ncbi:hypothetical protein [Streptomyces beigongshangae]|uniref:hypothetical protein n=1 Tax=Streptomyces beigongshangae TaxID=2841597 RepID=UPI001C843CC1|nr:hypothetical protein [Streptomyces sp. REN17]
MSCGCCFGGWCGRLRSGAREYLWKASWCFHAKDDPAAEDWVAEHALALLDGRCAEAAARIARQADDLWLTTERRESDEGACATSRTRSPYLD